MLHRKDNSSQRPLNYHLAPPNPAFAPHPVGRAFPPQYPGVSRLPFRVPSQHPGGGPAMGQPNQHHSAQLSPAYASGSHNPSFFGGAMASHRGVPETEEEGPEEMGNSMRSQMGHQGGHHPALSQPSRVNSFGEENQEGGLGDGMGEFYHRVQILRVLLFFYLFFLFFCPL